MVSSEEVGMVGVNRVSVVVLMAVVMLSTLLVAPAKAATVGGCTGGLSGSAACVTVTTGSKDFSTRRQWVGRIVAHAPNYGGLTARRIEVWTDGFYSQRYVNTQRPHFVTAANKWVRSGHAVCTRITYSNGYAPVACIAIRV